MGGLEGENGGRCDLVSLEKKKYLKKPIKVKLHKDRHAKHW